MSKVEVYELRGRIALANAAKNTANVSRRHLREALTCAQRLDSLGCPRGSAYSLLLRAGVANVLGQHRNSIKLLVDAIDAFEVERDPLYAAAADRRLGEVLGDRERVRGANARLALRGVRDPEAMTRLLAPGWGVAAPGVELAKKLRFDESGVRLAREQRSETPDRIVVDVPVRRNHAV
jgi:hypothetical protein